MSSSGEHAGTLPDMDFDLIVIGSGFGGAMAAAPAVFAGKRVLMIEAGGWVDRGPHNWGPAGMSEKTPYYSRAAGFDVVAGGYGKTLGVYRCVGGASVFYGGVAMRMRVADFESSPEIDGQSGASWPYRYADLEPFYTEAEGLLSVSGAAGEDPTEPPRSAPFPRPPAPLANISTRISDAARGLGLHPFRLPLAINYRDADARTVCVACGTCDGFACAVQAKNDISVVLVPRLQQLGMTLMTDTPAVRLEHTNGRVTSVVCSDGNSPTPRRFQARSVVVACGALTTPRLLLGIGDCRHQSCGRKHRPLSDASLQCGRHGPLPIAAGAVR
jgi:choline dehydrogenase-like flavoprotein